MALPIWAHARGKTYSTLIMQEAICTVGGPSYPGESCLGWHESYSSPELYFCRPLQHDRGAGGRRQRWSTRITCPSQVQQREGQVRSDDAVVLPAAQRSHHVSSPATAAIRRPSRRSTISTRWRQRPPLTAPTYNGIWSVPGDAAAGRLHAHGRGEQGVRHQRCARSPGLRRRNLAELRHRAQLRAAFGRLSGPAPPRRHDGGAWTRPPSRRSDGYGDWTGATGVDQSARRLDLDRRPGSGEGRLLPISANGLSGRVIASVAPCTTLVCDPVTNVCSICDPAKQECTPLACSPPPAAPGAVTNLAVANDGLGSTSVTLQFDNAGRTGRRS